MDPRLSAVERRLLASLPADGASIPVSEAAKRAGFAVEVQALQAAGGPVRSGLVDLLEDEVNLVQLTAAARGRAQLPEVRAVAVFQGRASMPLAEVARSAGLDEAESRVLPGLLKRAGWADLGKGPEGPVVTLRGADVSSYAPAAAFQALLAGPQAAGLVGGDVLLERGLAERVTQRTRSLRLTPEGKAAVAALGPPDASSGASEVGQVTPELVQSWPTLNEAQRKAVQLRPYAFDLDVSPAHPGKAHPLSQIIQEIRGIFWKMGFQEIAGDYVESAFWNMDALFIPQDHPAREMQDTFYLADPGELPVPKDAWQKVRSAQLDGAGTGSTGWGGSFGEATSRKALLRTHTTVTTIKHLAANPATPCKVFGIGRVFRNEAMDATHLPEFHQIEGIVMEEGASFGTLMGLLREFYARMGFPEVRFRPSYYPYTEPSLDVAVKWEGRWLELGGAGVFRPEVTHPLGVKMPVLAWGLGLERLAMLRLGLKDIRQLYLSDIQWLRENPVQ